MVDWQDQLTPEIRIDFWNKVATGSENECWLWFAARAGYPPHERGSFRIHGVSTLSHRVAWVITNGRILEGLHVLHKCDNMLCCNPKHLFLGTHQDNMTDAATKGRMYRRRTRSFTPEQVIEIRKLYKESPSRKISAVLTVKYNTSPMTIWRIVNRVTYQDIP